MTAWRDIASAPRDDAYVKHLAATLDMHPDRVRLALDRLLAKGLIERRQPLSEPPVAEGEG